MKENGKSVKLSKITVDKNMEQPSREIIKRPNAQRLEQVASSYWSDFVISHGTLNGGLLDERIQYLEETSNDHSKLNKLQQTFPGFESEDFAEVARILKTKKDTWVAE